MRQRNAFCVVLLSLSGHAALASQTICTFEGGETPQYYELEFIGYSDSNPTIAFSSTALDSGKRITLSPENYSLKEFNQNTAVLSLEFRNPGNRSLPPSFSLDGRNGHAQLKMGAIVVDGSLQCGD